MADGYLPPVVVRLVAETAEAVAALDAFTASLGEIGARAAAAGAEVDAAFTGMAGAAQRVDAAMAETSAATAEASASMDRMAASATAANDRAAASYTAPTAAADRYAAQADADAARVAAAQDRVAASNQAMAAKVETDSAGMEAANARAVTSTEKVGTAMETTGAKSGVAGALTSKSMGLIGLGAAGVAVETVKMASNFDQSMNKLVTMANQPQPVVDGLKKKVLDLGASTGQGPDKLAEGLYHLVSTGMNADQAMAALTSSAKLATMGTADLDTVTYALSGIMSAAPKDIQNTDQAVAIMATTVGQGDMTVQGFADSMKSGLLPTMISAGMGMRDYSASLATIADNSIPPEMAANRLRTAVSMMANETGTKAVGALKDLGIGQHQLADDMRQGGMLQAMTDLKSHMENLKPAAGDAKMSIQDIDKAGKDFYDQVIADGGSVDDATKSTAAYKKTLQDTGTAGQRAFQDIADATGGSKSASTVLLLTDETGKLQQKYDTLGTSVDQEKKFQDNWNEAQQQTAVKLDKAKAGVEALGIKIGENLMPAVNTVLDAVARFGGALEQGSTGANILAGVIEGVLGLAVLGLGLKIVGFVGGPIVSLVKGFGSVMGSIADFIAKMLGVDISTKQTAAATETAMAESEAAVKTASAQMVATWKIALEEMLAATRAESGPIAAAAEETGAAAGKAEQAGMRAGIASGKAETTAASEAAGTEAGAAESTGMAGGLEAGKAKVAAAGTAAGAAAGASANTGWLGKFKSVVGGLGMVAMGVTVAYETIPEFHGAVDALSDYANHMFTGAKLSQSTMDWEAHCHRISNDVRDALGLAKLYSDDGVNRINTSLTQGADKTTSSWDISFRKISNSVRDALGMSKLFTDDGTAKVAASAQTGANNAATFWNHGVDLIPPATKNAVTGAGTEANKFPGAVNPPINKGADDAKARVGKMPGEFSQAVAPMPGQMKTAGGNTMQGFQDGQDPKANSIIDSIKTWAGNLLKTAMTTLGIASPSSIMNSAGVDFMQGFLNGLMSMMDSITTTVNNWVTGIVNTVRSALAINSPSHVMHELGEGFMEGFHNGIMARQQDVLRACSQTAQLAVGAFSLENANAHAAGWAGMQGFIDTVQDTDALARVGFGEDGGGGSHKNQWGCWICGQSTHQPLYCPNRDQVLTLTRSNSGIGVQDSTTQVGNVTNITVQGTVLDHQGIFQALQEAALRAGQRNSFTGGFGSPR